MNKKWVIFPQKQLVTKNLLPSVTAECAAVGYVRISCTLFLMFKGLTALRLYKSFGVKGLIR
jgi:hypothetical protein